MSCGEISDFCKEFEQWHFIEMYAVFVLNLCGEKSVWRKSLMRKNDKYEVCAPVPGFGHRGRFALLFNLFCLGVGVHKEN